MVRLESVAIGITERVGEFRLGIVEIMAKGLGSEIETTDCSSRISKL